MPILGIFGAKDDSIPVKTVEKFQSTLDELGKEAEFHIYDNAGHAFANPSDQNYVPEAAESAWDETTKFLEEHLVIVVQN
jgi:carboxymethylenebutenolidase